MSELQAEWQLLSIEAASVPHMDKPGRDGVFTRLLRVVGRSQRPKPATTADLAALGIRVEQPEG